MEFLLIAAGAAGILLAAYFTYGNLLARLLNLDPDVPTPAVTMRDDVDYAPIDTKFLLGQHFSAIAAAGPIVGPILAGLWFGWAPALVWILVGSILIGGFHDMASLVASVRHKARSIAEVVKEHMSRRAFLLFLAFVWIALVYIIVAFTDVVAGSFVGIQKLENGLEIHGSAIAASSAMYLALPVIMGLLLRYTRLSLGVATAIFLPLVGLAIWGGRFAPIDLAAWLGGLQPHQAHKIWDVILLLYCFVASLVPMWLLLQPRGHLGGYFLYVALGCFAAGLLFGGRTIEYPAFIGWVSEKGAPLFPILFITIACGACSGFHSIIATGTTCKQLKKETDAKPIGYGAMLLEAMVAVTSLFCVMMLTKEKAAGLNKPDVIYANGLAGFLSFTNLEPQLVVTFGLLAFTTFVYDTLDVCTRLGRYILQELTGAQGPVGRWLTTAVMVLAPLYFLLDTPVDDKGNLIPAWRKFWTLFGASNQLLAALTLIGLTVWLLRTTRKWWVLPVAGLPTVFMYVMSGWTLLQIIEAGLFKEGAFQANTDPVPWVALVLLALAALVALEAILVFARLGKPPAPPQSQPTPAPGD